MPNLSLIAIAYSNPQWLGVQGAFHDNFPGFLSFGFRRKLVHTKNQQVTDKVSKHNGRTVFLWDFVFHTHQQKCPLFYHLSSLCFTSSQFVPTSLFASSSASVSTSISASTIALCCHSWSHVRSAWWNIVAAVAADPGPDMLPLLAVP